MKSNGMDDGHSRTMVDFFYNRAVQIAKIEDPRNLYSIEVSALRLKVTLWYLTVLINRVLVVKVCAILL